MLFNRKKKKIFYLIKKKPSHSFPFFFVPVNRDEFKCCVYMGKTVPANRDPGSSMPRSRFAGTVFSHINAILFLVRFVSQTRSRQTEGLG